MVTAWIVDLPTGAPVATDSNQVQSGMQKRLGRLARNGERVQQFPTAQVIGHTEQRAKRPITSTVRRPCARRRKTVLVSNGVPGARIRSVGRGESQPVASNLNATG